jgi:hypothetical protein
MMRHPDCSGTIFRAAVGLALGATIATAKSWQVKEAPLRFRLHIARAPTHSSAGCFVSLPDGGILPGPFPLTTVVTESGQAVESYLLWHHRESGLAMVFDDPGSAQSVFVYVEGSEQPRLWSSGTGITPSAILCADPTAGTMSAARKLARMGRAGPTVHYRNKAGIHRAPLSIGGDDTGRPRPAAFYLLAYLDTTDPGDTWIAPFVLDGECVVEINGKPLTPKNRIDKWGGTGQLFNLSRGLQRVEVFQACPGSGGFSAPDSQGLMYLTWRTPNAGMEELGGVRSSDVPMSGTSRMETRVIRDDEIVRSGRCTLEEVQARDSAPVAVVAVQATQNFWFEGELPVLVYELQAHTAGNPEDTRYTWNLGEGTQVEGKSIHWLFPGWVDNRVTLTAASSRGTSQCVHLFYGFTSVPTSLGSAPDRRAYRRACTAMLQAYPTQTDPTATWPSSYWNNLIRTLEFGKGYPALLRLFESRGSTLRGKFNTRQVNGLQDIFLDVAPRIDPDDALKWIKTFHDATGDAARRHALQVREAEVYMFYKDDPRNAARILNRLAGLTDLSADPAKVRLGDLALMVGELNRAANLYADVQNRARGRADPYDPYADGMVADQLLAGGDPQTGRTAAQPGATAPGEEWRVGPVLDVAISESVTSLMHQGHLLEARRALQEWERRFPLSKISGDYILQESRLFMRVGDWRRARPMLEAYCNEIDASSFLPDAASALVKCMLEMKEPKEKIRETTQALRKRLEFHPVAKELDQILGATEN